jgi:multidrug efflux system membrane fusion protein
LAFPILTSRFWQTSVVVALLAWVTVGCKKQGEAAGAGMPQRPPAVVTTAPAVAKDVPLYLDEIGTIASPDNVSIKAQVAGKLLSAHFVEGAEVKKGDLLFKVDPRPYQAALDQARADMLQATVARDLAKSEYERAIAVKDMRALSQEQIDQRKNAVAVAEAQMAARQAAVETAELNLEYCDILAPVTGRTGKRLVDPGNLVDENDETLVVIQSLDPIFADFTVSENDLGTVRKYIATRGLDLRDPEQGLKCFVDVPGNSARVLAALGAPAPATQPDKNTAGPRQGKLVFLDNAVQSGAGTVQLRAVVPNADRYFWPGQFVNVRLILTTKKDAVMIPTQAQQVGQQGPFVFVVTKDNTAELRPIKLGQRQGEMVVVESGLSAGENVVVTGQMMLGPGAPVQVMPGAGQGPTTAPAAPAAPAADASGT